VTSALAQAPSTVLGVYCKRSHFNDPAVAYCTVCGIAMAQATRRLVPGPRPQLGVLVLDDGSMYPLTGSLVLGRAPSLDPAVAAGSASPVRLADPLVSRVHARIMLDGWQVVLVDAGSRNGTFVCAAGQSSWTRLARGGTAVLATGAMVAFCRRELRYHSYRNV
jgi:pSer/pThr/pTyr-binding forkhead associated (FHA) protein